MNGQHESDCEISFVLPKIDFKYKTRINKCYASVFESSANWAFEYLRSDGRGKIMEYLGADNALAISLCYPDADQGRLHNMVCLCMMLFSMDDYALESVGMVDKIALQFERNKKYGAAIKYLMDAISSEVSARQANRFKRELKAWISAVGSEDVIRSVDTPLDRDGYLKIRRESICGLLYITQVEYALGLELEDDLLKNEAFINFNQLAIDYWLFVNDLFSFRREYYSGDKFNYLISLISHHGLAMQDAVDELCGMIGDTERRIFSISEMLLSETHDKSSSDEIGRYLDGVKAVCAGNLTWSFVTSRYHGRGYIWNGLRGGDVTLSSKEFSIR